MKKQILFITIAAVVATHSMARRNIIKGHDINFQVSSEEGQKEFKNEKNISFMSSFGITQRARNSKGEKVPSPQYLYAEQNAFAMLKGLSEVNPEAAALAQRININGDNGERGRYKVDGEFQVPFQGLFSFTYMITSQWFFGFDLPFYSMKFSNISWENQTKDLTGDDRLTRELLTDNFFSNVARLGDGLNLQDWSDKGVGDATCMITWSRQFPQNKPWIKQVNVTARGGVTLPTGVKKDEDKAFSQPFGYDGAYSVPFGAGLDVRFKEYAWVGINATFEHIFSHTKIRRIMTDAAQTNYLYLQKTNTRKEYGFIQTFNLYIEPKITDSLRFRCSYIHTKTGDDKLFVLSEDYSSIIANKDIALEEGTTHDLLLQLKWDAKKAYPHSRYKPQGTFFAQVPFNGRGTLQSGSLGFSFAFDF